MTLLVALPLLGLLSAVSGHGHVSQIEAGGKTYVGADHYNYDPASPGWLADNGDNGFVSPDAFSTPDIICHKNGQPSSAYATVAAGDTVKLTWNTWPDSHHGPVLDYLAECAGGDCSSVDKTSLSFVKLDAQGLISGSNPGVWATDDLINDGFSWTVTIPSSLKAGSYVLRHEIIALHSAGQENGAQAYPQCINLKVTGGGSTTISGGESATKFYTPTDPGILISIYGAIDSYQIPGPAVWKP